MTLLDLRRYAVRNRLRVHFRVDPAGECIINEHGVLKIPSLRGVPDFNVENLLASVEGFTLTDASAEAKSHKLSRGELENRLKEPAKIDVGHEE